MLTISGKQPGEAALGGIGVARTRRGAVAMAGLVEPLSAREQEVLALLARAQPNGGIADELVITVDTVKRQVSHLFDKLAVANRTEAVGRARQLGRLP
ncbi:MAG: response regulator transcription factor [Geodermatophilaceae bacterium]|nr:response regulator transcription factor [Geodermatophilaceae bacterium]